MMNIRKTGWIAALVLIFTSPAAGKVYWGLRAGVARSSLVQQYDLDYLSGSCLGYSLAALADIPFYQRFSFRPEIALIYEGGSFLSYPVDDGFLLRNRMRGCGVQPSFNLAFNIPISGVKMAVYGGPALNYLLYDQLTTRPASETEQAETEAITEKGVRPFDIRINAGISVEYKGVFFSINALAGSSDRRISKTPTQSPVYQNNLTFSLGYFFR
jgi:hypothetical protein